MKLYDNVEIRLNIDDKEHPEHKILCVKVWKVNDNTIDIRINWVPPEKQE